MSKGKSTFTNIQICQRESKQRIAKATPCTLVVPNDGTKGSIGIINVAFIHAKKGEAKINITNKTAECANGSTICTRFSGELILVVLPPTEN